MVNNMKKNGIPDGMERFTINIPTYTYKKIRLYSCLHNKTMRDTVVEILEDNIRVQDLNCDITKIGYDMRSTSKGRLKKNDTIS